MTTRVTKPPVAPINVDSMNAENVWSPHYRTVFSNNVRIITSPGEVRVTFSHFSDVIRNGKVIYINEDEVSVVIPPIAIRTFLKIIEDSLANHEKLWGPLPPAADTAVTAKD